MQVAYISHKARPSNAHARTLTWESFGPGASSHVQHRLELRVRVISLQGGDSEALSQLHLAVTLLDDLHLPGSLDQQHPVHAHPDRRAHLVRPARRELRVQTPRGVWRSGSVGSHLWGIVLVKHVKLHQSSFFWREWRKSGHVTTDGGTAAPSSGRTENYRSFWAPPFCSWGTPALRSDVPAVLLHVKVLLLPHSVTCTFPHPHSQTDQKNLSRETENFLFQQDKGNVHFIIIIYFKSQEGDGLYWRSWNWAVES